MPRRAAQRNLWTLIAIVALVGSSFFLSGYFNYVFSRTLIYVIVAIGMNLLLGYGGMISLGNAGFMVIGGYTVAILADRLDLGPLLTLPAAGLVAALAGVIIGLPALRLKGFYLGMITLGFGVVVNLLVTSMKSLTKGVNGYMVARPVIAGVDLAADRPFFLMVAIVTIAVFLVASNFIHSRYGKALVASADDETAAEAVGTNLALTRVSVFALSAFFTGMAGGLYAYMVGHLNIESFSLFLNIDFITMVVIGGMASMVGSVLGALYLVLLPELMGDSPNFQLLIRGLMLVLVIILLPGGLVSLPGRIRSLFSRRGRGAHNPIH